MRLIDADALIAKLEDDSNYMEDNLAVMFTYAAINDIKRAPTVDAIDREKAIDTANVMYERCDTGSLEDYRDLMVEALRVLP